MNIKLIATDLDGTLFSQSGVVPAINAEALREAERRGIAVLLSSGRSFEFMRNVARDIGVNAYLSSSNGARIDASPNGVTVYEGKIDNALSGKVMRVLLASGVYFEAYTRGFSYVGNPENGTEGHARSVKRDMDMGGRMHKVVFDPDELLVNAWRGTYKYVCFCRDADALSRLGTRLDGLDVNVSSSGKSNLEITRADVNKGAALTRLAAMLGVRKSAILSFGDYSNDIPMFAASGHAVAMGNALPEVKEAAEYVALDHMEAGLGRFLFQTIFRSAGEKKHE